MTLVALWFVFIFLKQNILNPEYFYILKLVQITALMASIEFLGFFALHLFGRSKGVLIQGFLGGFISSTMVFIQMSDQDKTKHYNHSEISRSLILSTIAMLILGVVIIWTILEENQFQISLAFMLQSLALIASIFFIPKIKTTIPKAQPEHLIMLDDPIIWKNVLKFTFVLALIHWGVKAMTKLLPDSYLMSTFVIALFESHAILAAFLTDIQSIRIDPKIVISIILLGNLISKLFLTIKSGVLSVKKPVSIALIASYLFSLLAYFF